VTDPEPSGGRLGCATGAAILVPLPFVAILLELLGGIGTGGGLFPLVLLFGVPLAAMHVLPLFLPAYLLAARDRDVPWWGAATLGLVCGGFPAFMISGAEPGVTAFFAGAGLVGGLAFWLTMMATRI